MKSMEHHQNEQKPTIRKEKPIEDTLLYKQTMDFRGEINGILTNMNARHVPLYGTPMNDALRIALANFRMCYLMGAADYDDKTAYMRTACEKFAEVDILLGEWFAASIVNKKTYCRLAPMVGGILDGSKRFYDAVKKKRDSINGKTVPGSADEHQGNENE